ncbi:sensor histidine kinase [Nocardioides plantarum]|uniref:histidine kinase n=1 Tax=Nocardioides plantarum TaxID=29299 RepID=A0ABV5KCW1_9ACTN|nr:HAMP domain-containing sensor histidine kinase [Nocardioides plantarum]
MSGSPWPEQTRGSAGQGSAGDGSAGQVERRWHYRRSLASRVTLLTTFAVGLSVAFLSVGVYVTARAQLQAQLDDDLRSRATKIAETTNIFDAIVAPTLYTVGASDVRIALAVIRDGQAYGVAKDGTTNTEIVGRPEAAVAQGKRSESMRTVRLSDGDRYRVIAVPSVSRGQAVVLARSLENQDAVLSRLGVVSLVFGLLGVLGAGAAGWGVARNGLRPVRRLTTSVETIARTEQLDALPVEGDDEVARLAAAFNEMLTALSASRDRQRQLVTDAGHELRTPLTSLRTNVDLLVQSDQDQIAIDPTARAELLEDIRAQTDELTTLIGDLTELARDEPLAPVLGVVDLSEIVDVSVARVRRRAPDKTFDVVTESWVVYGEAPSLERAVTNLLDNAAKWGPPGSQVTVRLEALGGIGRLTVDDQGPGIAEADRENVFDRFWRAEESRAMPGSGLGLSIVRQVVERHSGRVGAFTAPGGGARLVLELPGRHDA